MSQLLRDKVSEYEREAKKWLDAPVNIVTREVCGWNDWKSYVADSESIANCYIQSIMASMYGENDIEYGLEICDKAKAYVLASIEKIYGGDFKALEEWAQENHQIIGTIEDYYEILMHEAPHRLDSYCLFIEHKRNRRDRFYEPRRKTLKLVVDKLQALVDDDLDELFVHMPARIGKSQLMTMFCAWYCAKNPETSNLYATYKESLGGAFLEGVQEIWTDPTYCHMDAFPDTKIVYTDAKNHKIDLKRRKKYKTLSGKGLESGLNGEYDATGIMIVDDIIEGIQDVLNPEILKRKQIVFDNNLMSRKKEHCKVIYNGTIWSLKDIYMDRLDFLQNNPLAKNIRWEVLKIPALDPVTDESNFDYDYGVGFSTEYYRIKRAKFEENDDMASWMAQCQQEPIERDGAVFTPEHMKFYNGVLPNEEPLRICGACDVALGGLDYLAFVVAYIYENGDVYIHDVVYDSSEKRFTRPKVVEMIVNHNVGSCYFESNQGGEGYKDEVDAELRQKGIKINFKSEYAPTNKRKEQRIWDKAGSIRDWYFRDTGCRSEEYRKFMTNVYSFTINGKNKHDDAPDCLASLAYFIEGHWNTARVEVISNPFKGIF